MLKFENIHKQYDGQPVLQDIRLEVHQSEILCLLGASGSGKTTLLRLAAGLEAPDQGRITLDKQPIDPVPTHQRGFGLMFQDFALFPHMTVEQNVAFGLKMQGNPSQERTREMLALVGMQQAADRRIDGLSGGERQRVALARSLAPAPRLLMLDEPLGALDASRRDTLADEIRHIIKQVGLTAIYVTHDQTEAFAIADRVAIVQAGRIAQLAPPNDLYFRPASRDVATFLNFHNIFPVQQKTGQAFLTPFGELKGQPTTDYVLLHPAGLSLAPEGQLEGTIAQCAFLGGAYRLTVEHRSGHTLKFKVAAQPGQTIQMGQPVNIQVEPWAIIEINA